MAAKKRETKNQIRLRRLKTLKYMLENHSKIFKKDNIKFNIKVWKAADYFSDGECKTVACALGSACLYEPFKEEGLYLDDSIIPAYNNGDSRGCYAAVNFFNISYDEAAWLFLDELYKNKTEIKNTPYKWKNYETSKKVTAKRVAKRVDVLIKHYKKATKQHFKITDKSLTI